MAHIIYRQTSTDPGRSASSTKNVPLTNSEVDGNFKVIDLELATKAPLLNPTFSGTVSIPTVNISTDSDVAASTAYVVDRIANDAPSKTGSGASGSWNISITGSAASSAVCSGNSATATKLQTARLINGVSFDGSADINISMSNATTSYSLSPGSYISGSAFNGSSAVTWNISGTSASTANTLVARDASGDFSANVITASDFNTTSDARIKENVTNIESALNIVAGLQGVYFNYKNDITRRHVGLIAQNVKPVLPEVVAGSDDTLYSVSYANIVAVLIEAIKELKAQVDILSKP